MINQKDLLAAYDREHVGPPGRARELIAAAPITHPILLDTPEIAAREVVWLQDKDKEQPVPALLVEELMTMFVFKTVTRSVYALKDEYRLRWVAWDGKPTEEQMKEVCWQGYGG